jgi:hypothetical protein
MRCLIDTGIDPLVKALDEPMRQLRPRGGGKREDLGLAGRIDVVEIKTDAPPAGDVAAELPHYASQARTYAQLLAAAGLAADRRIRCGLLFTAEGYVRWL